jgi:hypothetical protein
LKLSYNLKQIRRSRLTKMSPKRRENVTSSGSKRDLGLLIILFVFNLWSGGTTVLGAQQVLPIGLAWISGIAVQVMLYCLLSGFVMKQSVIRRGIAVLFFSVFSIYTSFFCYYDILTGEASQRDQYAKASKAHQALVANLYTPIKNQVLGLQSEVTRLEELVKQECDVGVTTGEPGCGPKANQFRIEAGQKKAEYQRLNMLLQEITPKFIYETQNLKPKEIYERDEEALATVPEALNVSNYQIDIDDYISRDLDVPLLTPYYKVFRSDSREDAAVLALLIAIGVDGMAILQGTAIEIRQKRNRPVQSLSVYTQSMIRDVKGFLATLNREVQSRGVPIDESESFERAIQSLRKIIDFVHEKSGGKGSKFLLIFYNLITEASPPHLISYRIIALQDNEVFRLGFIQLIKRMSESPLNWVQTRISRNQDQHFIVNQRFYIDVVRWIEQERFRLSVSDEEFSELDLDNELGHDSDLEDDISIAEGNTWRDIIDSHRIEKSGQ